MTVKTTNEYYEEYDEHERYVSGEWASGPIYDGGRMLLSLGGMPEFEVSQKQLEDLRDVCVAALGLMDKDRVKT